jgi:hypothetical protein
MKNIRSIRVRQAAAALAMIFALSQPIAAQAMPGGFYGGGIHAGDLHGFGQPLSGGDHFGHWRADRISYRWWDDDPYLDGLADSTVSGQYAYYCPSSAGYYPYVMSCSTEWQQVPARSSASPGA